MEIVRLGEIILYMISNC